MCGKRRRIDHRKYIFTMFSGEPFTLKSLWYRTWTILVRNYSTILTVNKPYYKRNRINFLLVKVKNLPRKVMKVVRNNDVRNKMLAIIFGNGDYFTVRLLERMYHFLVIKMTAVDSSYSFFCLLCLGDGNKRRTHCEQVATEKKVKGHHLHYFCLTSECTHLFNISFNIS